MIAELMLALAAATPLDDVPCVMERLVTKARVATPLHRALYPAPVAASAPAAVKKKKRKRTVRAVEYEPCPPIVPPTLFSLIPPPDLPPPEAPIVMVPPAVAPTFPVDEPVTPVLVDTCDCFAAFIPPGGGGGGGGYFGGGFGGGGGPGGGGATPVPEPFEWALLLAGAGLLAYRRKTA